MAGNVYDSQKTLDLLEPLMHEDASVLAEKAFDTDAISEYIAFQQEKPGQVQ